jgi:hypothetical protein
MFVTDANGCTATVSGTVTEPPPIIPGICSQTNVTCYGDSNGCATACASNGIFPYTYEWSTGDTGTTICNLHPGQYSVIVYDANGCSADTFITITQPAPFFSTVCESNPPLCNQSADGCAVVCASGGTPNYTYTWLPTGGTGPTACGLTAGEYTCTVIDGNGCTFVSTVDIVQPNPITLSLSPTNASCSSCCDGSVTATAGGGTGQLYFIWTPSGDTGAIAAGLCPGINTCCVSDDNGCIACASDTVSFSNSVTDISFGSHLISVIPNPFTNELTITWNKGTGGRKDLSLFDITSKEILRRETSEEEIILHTENLATGFYLLRVGGENYKVVKEE